MLQCQLLVKFWFTHPALCYGLALLFGLYASLDGGFYLFLPLLALWVPFVILMYHPSNLWKALWKPLLLSLTLFGATYSFVNIYYLFPDLPKTGIKGTAHLSIQSIRLQKSFFGSRWIYQCQLFNFFPENHTKVSIAKHIKCNISIPNDPEIIRPLANQEYLVVGTLIKKESGFVIRMDPYVGWGVVKDSWSLAEARYGWKQAVLNWINNHYTSPLSALFLGGLATGEFDDQWLRNEFARFGVQHIMAISGFHFAIIVGILSLIVRLIFSRRVSVWLLMISMAGYTLFLGANPSIMRAWMMCSIVLMGCLLEKNGTGLNSLGVALIGVLMVDPLFCQTMGFQFSFLTTAAILLAFQPADEYLKQILPKRSLSQMIEMNGWNQHGYCLLAIFRQGLALLIAVNLFAVPLTLFYFLQFPWMSLLYNLFFPPLIAFSLGLLVLNLLTNWVPFLGNLFTDLNDSYTQLVLQLTYGMPASMDFNLNVDVIYKEWLVAYITLMLIAVILLRESLKDEDSVESFTFL